MLPFTLHEKLVLYSRQLLYNCKIEARLLLTEQRYVHLFRLQGSDPDFTFSTGKNIRIKVRTPLSITLLQWKRSLMLRE